MLAAMTCLNFRHGMKLWVHNDLSYATEYPLISPGLFRLPVQCRRELLPMSLRSPMPETQTYEELTCLASVFWIEHEHVHTPWGKVH